MKHIYDTVLYNYFCTEIIGGAFCIVCTTNLYIGGAFALPGSTSNNFSSETLHWLKVIIVSFSISLSPTLYLS